MWAEHAATHSGLVPQVLPWQSYALDRVLELHDQAYAWRTAVVVVGRGNGKSVLVQTRILHALVNRAQQVLLLAQNLDVAHQTYLAVLDTITADPHLAPHLKTKKRGKGDSLLEWRHPTAGRIATLRIASSEKGVRGPRAHLLVVDEAAIVDPQVYGAAVGVQQGTGTVPEQQTLLVSSAGDVTSTVLNTVRRDPDTLWLHWTLPAGADPSDPSGWPHAVPALGHRITLTELRAMRAASPDTFNREALSVWGQGTPDEPIPLDAWDACTPAPGGTPVAAAFDVTPDRAAATLVGITDRGHITRRSPPGCAPDELPLPDRLPLYCLPGQAGMAEHLRRQGRTVRVLTVAEYRAACQQLHDAVVRGEVHHAAEPGLRDAWRMAARSWHGDTWVLSSRRSGGDITPATATVVAWWARAQARTPTILTVTSE